MDLKAANFTDDKAGRLARASMFICFVIASVMLIASLAMAHAPNALHTAYTALPSSTLN